MSTAEKIAVAVLLLGAGVALGMYYEHERFLREMQGHVKQHKESTPKASEPAAPESAA
jgi:hypothetical protein